YPHKTSTAQSSLCLLIQPSPPLTTTPAVAAAPLAAAPAPAVAAAFRALTSPPPATASLLDAGVAAAGSGAMTTPFAKLTLLSFIHFQFSKSTSGNSSLNLAPPSPVLTTPLVP